MPLSLPKWLLIYGEWARLTLGVLAIIAGTLIVWALVRRAARRAEIRFEELAEQVDEDDPHAVIAAAQSLTTLQLVVNGVRYALFSGAALLLLSHLGLLEAGSLLLPAGFLGAALGLGAQNIVRDVLSGLFIVFEGQFAVGDQVKINGVVGRIEEVGLRMTSLCDETGQLHFFPNGAINTVARAPRRAGELWLWVPVPDVPDGAPRETVVAATRRALDDFDRVFDAWHEAPQLQEEEQEGWVRFALHVHPARAALVRDLLPARVAGALEAAGLKIEAGRPVELRMKN